MPPEAATQTLRPPPWGLKRALIASLFVANLLLLLMNIPMVGVFTRMLSIPNYALVPGIIAVSTVGVYAIHATTFDLLLMVFLGLLGYVLRRCDVPMAPLILGFVLGDMMEQNLRRALSITNGGLEILFSSPVAIVLWLASAAMLFAPVWRHFRGAKARGPAG